MSERVTDETLLRLSVRSARVNKLTLRQCTMITEDALTHIQERCPYLVSLNVAYCPLVTHQSVIAFLCSPRLRELVIAGCPK